MVPAPHRPLEARDCRLRGVRLFSGVFSCLLAGLAALGRIFAGRRAELATLLRILSRLLTALAALSRIFAGRRTELAPLLRILSRLFTALATFG
jgi:hypothetical protein